MVRGLLDHGYESVVVTGGGATSDRWAPEDTTLAHEIPEGIAVHRVGSAEEPPLSSGARRAAERWLGIGDRWAEWWARSSFRLGRDVGGDVDLIYVWMQPYASADAGAALSSALGRPWVADLGDPWALDEMMIFPSALHRRRALGEMRRLLGTASAIVMSTPEAADRLATRFPELAARPILAIPNGFDRDDFSAAPSRRQDGKFRIVHTGYLHTEIGLQHRRRRRLRELLRASPRGLDILTRSHVYLVEAVNELLGRRPELEGLLEVHLAGVLNEADRSVASSCSATRLLGYVTHRESIELMQTADLLFLPMQNLPRGTRSTIVPGKTYEYLASGSPIIAAVPDGDARDILGQSGNAILVRPDDTEGLVEGISSALDRWQSGAPAPAPDHALVARFEYQRLASDLAGVFDRVLAGTPTLASAARADGVTR
jgi:glycosyltransferase involved in cell wall biosynthesis